jgi:ubiquinone/menaquinone biosynthesis C-methylase UbiE
MRIARRVYYDKFSRFYDRFIALHSRDKRGSAREFLADQLPVKSGASVLDLCTGTATLLACLQGKVGRDGKVVGLDFSHGMLNVAHEKTRSLSNVSLVEADAGHLPFGARTFDAVTCSHAFYELKGQTRNWALREIVRTLKPQGTFLMMEHDVPRNAFLRALFYLRLSFVGSGHAIAFLRSEQDILARFFRNVEKVVPPGGRSKVLICRKGAANSRDRPATRAA